MHKKYISRSQIAINVKVGKHNRHITFDSQSGGGSVFSTEDEGVQKAMEEHYRFGELFCLSPESQEVAAKKVVRKAAGKGKDAVVAADDADKEKKETGGTSGAVAEEGADVAADGGGMEEGNADNGLKKVEMTSIEDAVEYLADKGVSRTKLKSIKSIKASALTLGIEFTGLE